MHLAAHRHARPQPLGPRARAEHDAARRNLVERAHLAETNARTQLSSQPRDRPRGPDRAAARIPQQRAGVLAQRGVALAGDVDDLRRHAGRAQALRVATNIPAESQRALIPDQRLARPRRPSVPGAPRPHRVEDLLPGRVEMTEAARSTR